MAGRLGGESDAKERRRIDRIARLTLGPVLVALGAAGFAGYVIFAAGPVTGAVGATIAVLVGTVLLVTGYTQTCPARSLLGVNTFRSKASDDAGATETPRRRAT